MPDMSRVALRVGVVRLKVPLNVVDETWLKAKEGIDSPELG